MMSTGWEGVRAQLPVLNCGLIITSPQEQLRNIVMSMSDCGSVFLSVRITPEPHTWSLPIYFVYVPCVRARSSTGTMTIGRIAYLREGVFFPIDNATGSTSTIFLCMLPMSVARSSSDMFTIGRIAYCWEGVFSSIENASSAGKGEHSAGKVCYLRSPCLGSVQAGFSVSTLNST